MQANLVAFIRVMFEPEQPYSDDGQAPNHQTAGEATGFTAPRAVDGWNHSHAHTNQGCGSAKEQGDQGRHKRGACVFGSGRLRRTGRQGEWANTLQLAREGQLRQPQRIGRTHRGLSGGRVNTQQKATGENDAMPLHDQAKSTLLMAGLLHSRVHSSPLAKRAPAWQGAQSVLDSRSFWQPRPRAPLILLPAHGETSGASRAKIPPGHSKRAIW